MSNVWLVILHMYDTSDDRYWACDSKPEALVFAANMVYDDLMDGARCSRADLRKLKRPADRLDAWAERGCSYLMEWSSGSIGLVKIVKVKKPTKRQSRTW